MFPLNRTIALGPSFYYLVKNEPSEKALKYIDRGLRYDPNAVDLLQAKITYSVMLEKNEEVFNAYAKLISVVPKQYR